MDVQVEHAIEIAWNPTSDQNLKVQAFDFLNQLRSEPQGWQVCFTLALRDPRASEVVRLVCLDVVNNAIKTTLLKMDDLVTLRDNLLAYVGRLYSSKQADSPLLDPVSIQNKLTQTVTYLFVTLYATHWTSFFHDVLSLTSTNGSGMYENAPGVVMYLRILISVHEEIADAVAPRSPEEKKNNNSLKDMVRERDFQRIATSWHEILAVWKSREEIIVELCLKSIGRWVSWTNVSLVVDDSLLNLLFELLSLQQSSDQYSKVQERREIAIDTFVEILSKKMGAAEKLELIDVLKVHDVVTQLVHGRSLSELRSTSEYDTDLAEAVAKLVNNTVCDIIKALESPSEFDAISQRGAVQLKSFLPHVLRFFSDEYDEVCSSVIPCLTDLLTLMRKKTKLKSSFATENAFMLPLILDAVVAKVKYDDTSVWGNENTQTDEAEFQELRKRLHILQQAIAAVDEKMYTNRITDLVISTFDSYQSQNGRVNWRDLDLAMHELFLFGELAMKNGGLYSKTKPVSPAAEQLVGMMFKLLEKDVSSFSHPAIQLQFMELCVRYYMFFEANPQYITRVLERFMQFVHHSHAKVKLRSWYLIQRFVKHVRHNIGGIAETVIRALGDLLPIQAELPDETSDNENGDVSSSENDQSASARFNSQLYLYETVGCVCSARAVEVENQVLLIRSVITPFFTDLEMHLDLAGTADKRAILQVHHLIMAMGTLARGFSDWAPGNPSNPVSPPAQAVSVEFAQAAEAILVALERLKSFSEVREAARFTFSRLVGVLGCQILPQLPRWIDGLLSQTSTKDEMALFMRILEQVVFGFKNEIYNILDALLTPFLQKVIAGMGEPPAGTDDEIQVAELKREYLNFLLVIFNNSLESVLVSETNQPVFGLVISTIEHLARDNSDYPTAKSSFIVLARMVSSWGGPDVITQPIVSGNDGLSNGLSSAALEGFDRFMMSRFSPLCWAIPSNANFDSKDPQGRQILGEAATLQKVIYAKTGQEYLMWLKNVELSGMGMDPGTIDEYLMALRDKDLKEFQRYFKELVQRSIG